MVVAYITLITSLSVSVSLTTLLSRFINISKSTVRRISQVALFVEIVITILIMVMYWLSGYVSGVISGLQLIAPDNISLVVSIGILLGAFIAVSSYPVDVGVYEVIVAVSMLGVLSSILITLAIDPIVIIVLWALISIASYSVIALARDSASLDASSRYIIVGVLASQFLLLGVGLLMALGRVSLTGFYGLSSEIVRLLYTLSLVLLLIALGFKLGSAPLHFWLPDVYGRASPYSIAIVAGSIKLGLVILLLRIVLGFRGFETLFYMLVFLSVLSMIIGSITPLTQSDIQRILAYSSVNHIGFILIGVVVLSLSPVGGVLSLALAGIVVHVLSYAISKSSLFSLVGFIRRSVFSSDLSIVSSRLSGSSEFKFSVVTHLANLIGVPPLPGFWSKLFLFLSATYGDPRLYIGGVPWLALLGVVASVISVFYYLNIIRALYLEKGSSNSTTVSQDVFYPYIASIILIVLGFATPLILVFTKIL